MKGNEVLNLVDLEDEDSSLVGLLGQRMFAIRKKVSLPPMFLVSGSVFRDMVEGKEIPEGNHISWELELDIARRFDELESPVARIIPSPSYEHSISPISLVNSKSSLVLGIDSLFRSFFEREEVEKREQMGVREFSVAAIVQKLFDAKCSGHLTQLEKETRFTAVHGLPMQTVGKDTYVLDIEGKMTSHSETEQKKKWVLGEKEAEIVKIKKISWDTDKLTEKQVARLASLGRKILEFFGESVTVEWYLVRNTFYLASLYPTKMGLAGS
ncbi:MAG: PEP/pyruvate-binding domain-containing protein [Thermoplasmata archaeon]